jgi:hypothetical protein
MNMNQKLFKPMHLNRDNSQNKQIENSKKISIKKKF